jgi:hypothetical protein
LSHLLRPAIAAEIPHALRDEDDLLRRYGRWAMHRNKYQRCGSAEGQYRSPANEDDRQPRELLMSMPDAMQVQRALSRVTELERVVLTVLYVPKRIPVEVQMRILHIPPELSRKRHLLGLRMFSNVYRVAKEPLDITYRYWQDRAT